MLCWMVALLIASWSLLGLRVDTSIGSALNRTDQSWKIYQRSLDLFGGDEFVAVALAPSAEPLASSSLAAVLDLTERFEALPSIRRVDSLSTVPLDVRARLGQIDHHAVIFFALGILIGAHVAERGTAHDG